MKFLNQMRWGTPDKHIGLSEESVNLTEWQIQGGHLNGRAKPISEPDEQANYAVAQTVVNKNIIVLNIENLRKQLKIKYPSESVEQIAAREESIRQGYYTRFKEICPDSLVIQYNQRTSINSDGFWLSDYRQPGESVENYLYRIEHVRLPKLTLDDKPFFFNISPVVFHPQGVGDFVMSATEFVDIVKYLINMNIPTLSGISFWYAVATSIRLNFNSDAEQCYESLFKVMTKYFLENGVENQQQLLVIYNHFNDILVKITDLQESLLDNMLDLARFIPSLTVESSF